MIRKLAEFWALLGGAVLLAIMLVTSLNIGAYALDRLAAMWGGNVYGITGYEDFVILAIAAAGTMFLPYCQYKRGHVVVDVFSKLMSPQIQKVLDLAWLLLVTVLMLFLAYWMIFGLLEVKNDNALTAILGWPVWPSYVPGILSLLLCALVSGAQIYDQVTK